MSKRRILAATLSTKQFRMCVQHNILQTGAAEGAEMAHQLYVLQTLMLGLLEQRMMTKMDPQVKYPNRSFLHNGLPNISHFCMYLLITRIQTSIKQISDDSNHTGRQYLWPRLKMCAIFI